MLDIGRSMYIHFLIFIFVRIQRKLNSIHLWTERLTAKGKRHSLFICSSRALRLFLTSMYYVYLYIYVCSCMFSVSTQEEASLTCKLKVLILFNLWDHEACVPFFQHIFCSILNRYFR